MIFEITSTFLIVFVRLILGKRRVDRFTGLQQEENWTDSVHNHDDERPEAWAI